MFLRQALARFRRGRECIPKSRVLSALALHHRGEVRPDGLELKAMSTLFRAAPDHPSVSGDSTVSLAPTGQSARDPSLPQALQPVTDRAITDVAMERASEDLAEREYVNLIRWAVRKAPELLRVLRIAYLFGQGSSSPEDAAAGAGSRLFRRSPRASTPYVQWPSEKLKDIEREHIRRILKESPSAVEAARRLGINYSTL